MKVRDLIVKLKSFDPDLEVYLVDTDDLVFPLEPEQIRPRSDDPRRAEFQVLDRDSLIIQCSDNEIDL